MLNGLFKRPFSRHRQPAPPPSRTDQCGFCGTDFMHPLDWGEQDDDYW
jgi:hypothetical protein